MTGIYELRPGSPISRFGGSGKLRRQLETFRAGSPDMRRLLLTTLS